MPYLRRGAVVALFLLSSLGLHAEPVSFANLAKHAEYTSVKISPDGDYLAAGAVIKGQKVLALIRLKDKKGQVIRPREGDDLLDFSWASPTRVVYSVGTHVGGYDAPLWTGELFAVNADGGNPKLLYGFRKENTNTAGSLIQNSGSAYGSAEFIAAIPKDPEHALVSVTSWEGNGKQIALLQAERIDLRNGNLSPIIKAPARGLDFIADHQGRIRLAYGEDKNGNAKIYSHPINGDGWQEMTQPEGSRSFPMTFNRDDSLVYFSCPAKTGGFGVCTWSPTTNQWNTVWSNPRVAPSGLLQGLAADDVAGVEFEDGRPGAALFDSNSAYASTLISLMKQFPGEHVSFVSASRDGHFSIVRVAADVDPGTFYLYDRDGSKLSPLLAEASWIDPTKMAAKQPFDFAARDGLKLQGYVSYPPGEETAKHLPMVVVVHGGPYGVRDDWNFDPYVQAFATRGYAVLQVNYRGSGGYGYDFERAGWGEWGGKMQDDVTDATRWAIAQGIADPSRICIFGGSYGGYAALEGAVKEPALYKCAIGYVGVYDLALMYQRGDIPQSTYGKSYLNRVLGNDMTMLAARSPINQLDHLKAKVMLVVGGEDPRVPSIQGSNLHYALLKRNIAHVWIDKPGEMHGFYDETNLADLYAQMVQFVGSSIGAGTQAPTAAVKK